MGGEPWIRPGSYKLEAALASNYDEANFRLDYARGGGELMTFDRVDTWLQKKETYDTMWWTLGAIVAHIAAVIVGCR